MTLQPLPYIWGKYFAYFLSVYFYFFLSVICTILCAKRTCWRAVSRGGRTPRGCCPGCPGRWAGGGRTAASWTGSSTAASSSGSRGDPWRLPASPPPSADSRSLQGISLFDKSYIVRRKLMQKSTSSIEWCTLYRLVLCLLGNVILVKGYRLNQAVRHLDYSANVWRGRGGVRISRKGCSKSYPGGCPF